MMTAEPINYRGSVLLADFADVRLGEMATSPLLYSERQTMTRLVDAHGGQNMESSTRNFCALFPQGANALLVARQILHDVVQWRNTDPNRRGLSCRLILGYGQVTVENSRIRSDWTHRLSGLVSQVPEYAVGALPEYVEHINLNPMPKALGSGALYLVSNLEEEAGDKYQTRHAPSLQMAETGVFTEITLTLGGKLRVIKTADCPQQIGRDKTCGIILIGDMVSRVHGRLGFEHGKFFYADDSRNGTYVLTASGEEIFLRNERLPLIGQGAISPGAPLATQTGQVLRFSCTSNRLTMAGDKGGDTRPI